MGADRASSRTCCGDSPSVPQFPEQNDRKKRLSWAAVGSTARGARCRSVAIRGQESEKQR